MIRNFLIKMLISAGFLSLFSIKFVDVTIGERLSEYPLETAWKATGVPLREVNTEAWLKLNDQRLSVSQLKELAEEIKSRLGLRPKTKIVSGDGEDFSYVSFEGNQPDGTNVSITIQSTRSAELSETQLGVYTVHTGEIKNLRQYIQRLRGTIASLSSDGGEIDFNVIFTGEHSGKIAPNLVRELSGRAFRKIEAELVDSAFEDGDSNQRGFSKLIQGAVEIDTRPVNIEFDTRFDRARNRTQIILATPRSTDGV